MLKKIKEYFKKLYKKDWSKMISGKEESYQKLWEDD